MVRLRTRWGRNLPSTEERCSKKSSRQQRYTVESLRTLAAKVAALEERYSVDVQASQCVAPQLEKRDTTAAEAIKEVPLIVQAPRQEQQEEEKVADTTCGGSIREWMNAIVREVTLVDTMDYFRISDGKGANQEQAGGEGSRDLPQATVEDSPIPPVTDHGISYAPPRRVPFADVSLLTGDDEEFSVPLVVGIPKAWRMEPAVTPPSSDSVVTRPPKPMVIHVPPPPALIEEPSHNASASVLSRVTLRPIRSRGRKL